MAWQAGNRRWYRGQRAQQRVLATRKQQTRGPEPQAQHSAVVDNDYIESHEVHLRKERYSIYAKDWPAVSFFKYIKTIIIPVGEMKDKMQNLIRKDDFNMSWYLQTARLGSSTPGRGAKTLGLRV